MSEIETKEQSLAGVEPTRPTDWLILEVWRDIRTHVKDVFITISGILSDLVVTLVILGGLQLLHVTVGAMRVPDWLKVVVSKVHEYSYLIVIILVALGFILRMAAHLYDSHVGVIGRRRDEPNR